MGKPEVNRRPLTLIGVLAALGLAAALAVATPSAAGAQTRGHYEGFKVVTRAGSRRRGAAGLNEDPGANPVGDVVRIDRHGQRTHLEVGKLFFPSGFAAAPDGAIYVSNCSIAPASGMSPKLCPTGGQVVRIR